MEIHFIHNFAVPVCVSIIFFQLFFLALNKATDNRLIASLFYIYIYNIYMYICVYIYKYTYIYIYIKISVIYNYIYISSV